MALTAAEQYMLELINRTRLDPAAEAARFGISLNYELPSGTLGGYARQVLAPNSLLEKAAIAHSLWQLANDVFSHTGKNGSTPTDRVTAAGYVTTSVGENLAWTGTTGTLDLEAAIGKQHRDLFLSKDHRVNTLYDSYREVGVAQEAGKFYAQGHDFNSSIVTQNFAKSGEKYFVTGVAYSDRNGDGFYSMGEGTSGVKFASASIKASSAAQGGYALKVGSSDSVTVTGTVGTKAFSVMLDTSEGNAKLDVINGNTFYSSVDVTLKSGIQRVKLLGVGDLDASGNDAANNITGNKGANVLSGYLGRDKLTGQAGNDKLWGGKGADTLFGGAGSDHLMGEEGNDVLAGGAGSDTFVFTAGGGADRITDYSAADRLQLDDAIWNRESKTAAQIVAQFGEMDGRAATLDFGNGQVITVGGLTSLAALTAEITVI